LFAAEGSDVVFYGTGITGGSYMAGRQIYAQHFVRFSALVPGDE